MTETKRRIIEAAYAPEPEVLTEEEKKVLGAVRRWVSHGSSHRCFGEVKVASQAYVASLKPKPKLDVPWPEADVTNFVDTSLLWVVRLAPPRQILSSVTLDIADEDSDAVQYLWSSGAAARRGLRRARHAKMRRQYPDATDAQIAARLDAFGRDGVK